MEILITGFKPFGHIPVNPSEIIAKSMQSIKIKSNFPLKISSKVLPVEYEESSKAITKIFNETNIDYFIALGVQVGIDHIELEKTAKLPQGFDIKTWLKNNSIEMGILPESINSSIDFQSILKEVANTKIPIILSNDTGNYLCNHVHYLANLYSENLGVSTKSFFIHIPYPYPYWVESKYIIPDFSISEIQHAILQIIKAIISSEQYQFKNYKKV